MKKNKLSVLALLFACGVPMLAQDLIPEPNTKGKWGFVNSSGSVIVKHQLDAASYFDFDGIAIVKKNNLYGFLQKDGTLGKCKYTSIQRESENIYKVSIGGKNKDGQLEGAKWGYVDSKEQILIPIAYDMIYPFQNEEAYVMKGKKTGMINRQGNLVFPLKYTAIGLFDSHGYTWANSGGKLLGNKIQGGKWGIVSKNGSVVVPVKYKSVGTFLPTEKQDSVIQYNTASNSCVNYSLFTSLNESLAPYYWFSNVENGKEAGVIDRSGKTIIASKYDDIYAPTSGMIIGVKEKRNYVNYSYYNIETKKELSLKLNSKENQVGMFLGETACVKSGDGFYLINKEGNKVSDNYENLIYTTQDLYLGCKGDKYGAITTQGSSAIPFEYDGMMDRFTNGLLIVKNANGYCGAVNSKNEAIIPFEYNSLGSFDYGTAVVEKDGKYGYLGMDDKALTAIHFDEAEALSYEGQTCVWVKTNSDSWRYFDLLNQNYVFETTYKDVSSFSEEGLGIVMDHTNKYGVINNKGEIILPLQFASIEVAMNVLGSLYERYGLRKYTDKDIYLNSVYTHEELNTHSIKDLIPDSQWDY